MAFSYHVRSFAIIRRRRCRSARARGSMLGRRRAAAALVEPLFAVSRPRNSERDVRTRRAPRVPPARPPALLASASETARRAKEREPRERDCAMAVSQPRPPDRVDAALEKVAPLRYLKAHECRAERAVTRYYHNSLSNNSFLSYNRRFEHFHEVFNGLSPLIQRYVNVFDFSSCKVGESLSLLVGEISLQSCISRLHKLGWLLIFEYSIDSH